jgi:ABC-type lipoprotein release transport system permease subunit
MAWRNVWRNPRRTAVVVTAVAVGIAGAIVAMAVNFGMAMQMVETAIKTELGHIQIHAAGYDANPELKVRMTDGGSVLGDTLEGLDDVTAFARRVRGEGLVTSSQSSVGVRVIGIEPQREAAVSIIADSISDGVYLDGTRRRVLIGERLAKRLHVGVGDKLVLSATDLTGDIAGEGVRVGGVFHTPSALLDSSTVFLPIGESQSLLQLDRAISEIVIVGDDSSSTDALRDELVARFGDHEVRSWKELRPVLQYMITVMDQMGWFMYGAVFIAMLFGIANVLLMTVYERVREIGILMAVGMSRSRLAASVVIESLLVTGLGVVIGYAFALGGVSLLSGGIDLSYFASGLEALGVGQTIVPVLRAGDFVIPTVVAIGTACVASGWPAFRATRFRPAEAVRHV